MAVSNVATCIEIHLEPPQTSCIRVARRCFRNIRLTRCEVVSFLAYIVQYLCEYPLGSLPQCCITMCDVTCDAVLQREPPCDTYQHPKRVCGAKIKIDGRVDDFFVKNGAYCHCQGAVRDGECARAWLPADNTSALNWFHHERSMYAAMFYMYMYMYLHVHEYTVKKYMFERVDVCDSDELGDFVSLSRVLCLRQYPSSI